MLKKSLSAMAAILLIANLVNAQVPQLINYQGVLIDPATGQPIPDDTYTMVFSIYNSQSPLATPVWTETHSVETKDGAYNVMLGSTTPLTPTILSGPEKYLGLKVGSDPEMTPRKRIVSVAYSILSEDADKLDGKHGSEFANANHNHDTRYYTESELNTSDGDPPNQGSNRMSWDNLNDMPSGFADGVDNTGSGWSLTGNSGTTPGTNFLGTTDNKALEIKVDNKRALRVEPSGLSPNIMGGHAENSITAGVEGAVIAGGGATDSAPYAPNRVTDNYGTVSGGYDNQAGDGNTVVDDKAFATVGGGQGNIASGVNATIAGGRNNTANGSHATVSGGVGNIASGTLAAISGGNINEVSGISATVGGGSGNTVSADYATIAGGRDNEASGSFATVPGGYQNTAAGSYSFAAGTGAKANHANTFVWNGKPGTEFASTGAGDFLINTYGVGIGTNNPASLLSVGGTGVQFAAVYGEGWGSVGLDYGGYFVANGIEGRGIYARGGIEGYAGEFEGNVLIHNGRVTTPVLEITGGSDLSEQFEIRMEDTGGTSVPGMVVSIDPENPGELVVCNKAYDKKVAGIISGAGGVKPGMLMGQEGTKADGSNPVALTGRVYCQADASKAPIEPGDLLTTSNTLGHAMKVTDYTRAQGAIIGKAMSSLEQGRGLVLVLVSLQ